MALTQKEKEDVLRFCKWPAQAVRRNTIFYNDWLDRWILNENLTPETEDEIRVYIQRIRDVDTRLGSATKRLAVNSIGNEIRINEDEIDMLRMERNRIIRELKRFIMIPDYRY